MTNAKAIALSSLLSLSSGCTFDEGRGFCTLEGARLSVSHQPAADRVLEGGALVTDNGYEVVLERADFTLSALELEELLDASTSAAFDPAHPPPGYTFCDGDHCHAEDGRLVDVAEVEKEAAAGGPRFVPLVRLPSGASLSLLAGESTELSRVLPSPELPRAEVRRLILRLDSLALAGSVSGGADNPGFSASFELDSHEPLTLTSALDWTVDRDSPSHVRLDTALVVDAPLFDGIDFQARAKGGKIDLSAEHDPDAERVLEALLDSSLTTQLR